MAPMRQMVLDSEGIEQFVVGSGGNSSFFMPAYLPKIEKVLKDISFLQGYLEMNVSNQKLEFYFKDSKTGRVLDYSQRILSEGEFKYFYLMWVPLVIFALILIVRKGRAKKEMERK